MSKSLNINAPQIVQTRNTLNAVPSGSTAEPDYNVKYVPQDLTEAQKAQARQNIGAAEEGGGGQQVQANWNETDTTSPAYIQNKPSIPAAQVQADWNQSDNTAVDYIKNKPSIPDSPVQSNWNETDTDSLAYIQNKPTIPTFLPSSNPVMFDKRTAELFFTRRNSVSLSAKYDWMWTSYTVYESSDPTQSQSIDMGDVSHAYLHFPTGGYWSTGEFSMNIYNDNEVWMWINDLDNGAVYFNQINFSSNGKFNVVYKGDFELYRFGFSTSKTNHPEQCWVWFMSNKYDGDYSSEPQYGNLVLADATMANFKILSSGSISSLITFDIYVPASRLTEFETRMQTLYGTSEYTSYIEPKVHTYDFIAQSGLTLKMINLG